MELINKVLNIVAPPLVILLLLLYVPLFQLPKLMFSVLRSFFFAEDVTGKVVIIPGAASGIGKELAYEYARRRACLVLADIREENLGKVADTCLEIGSPDVVTLTADVSNVNHCSRVVNSAISHFGRLDHLVNNAGIGAINLVEDYDDISNTRQVMDVNFWGSVYMTRSAIPHLRNTREKIIVMASTASWIPAPRLSIYNASKTALVAFYNTLRVEVGSDIHITVVTPGLTESETTEGKHLGKNGQMTVDEKAVPKHIIPLGKAESCAKAIVKGACQNKRNMTEPAWYRVTYWVQTFAPGLLEKILSLHLRKLYKMHY